MKLVFIAAPFRAETEWGRAENVRKAERIALMVWRAGAVAVCPQANSARFHGELPDEVFLAGYRELLEICDAVFVSGHSPGVLAEIETARRIGLPVFFTIDSMQRWILSTAE